MSVPARDTRVMRLVRAVLGRPPKASQECREALAKAVSGLRATSEVNRIVVRRLRSEVEQQIADAKPKNGATAHDA